MTKEDVKVSVIIPVYNVEPYITQSLESALAQTYPSIEFLLVDDFSSDLSADIVRRFQMNHPRGADIRLLSNPNNLGVSASRNRIIDEARGEYLFFMDADDVIREVMNHRLFYSYSGGGVTFSGGEATSQPEFLDYVSRELYDSGISTDIESCGFFDFDSVRPALERMDLIFMDLKHMDPDVHKKYTGVSNERILENIARLGTLGRPEGETGEGPQIVIRIPVIGGVNNSEENIAASAAYVHEVLPSARMELLPYHKLGRIKYEAAGIPFTQDEFYTPDKEEMKRLRAVAAAQGPEIADYR